MVGANSLTSWVCSGGMTSPQLILGTSRAPRESVIVTPIAGQDPFAPFSTCQPRPRAASSNAGNSRDGTESPTTRTLSPTERGSAAGTLPVAGVCTGAAVRTGAAVPAGAAAPTWVHAVPTPRTRAIGRSNNRRLGVSDMAALLVGIQLSTTLENGAHRTSDSQCTMEPQHPGATTVDEAACLTPPW